MRICVPTESEAGLGATVSRHLGKAPFFSVVDTVTGDLEVLGNRHATQVRGKCDPASQIADLRADAVVVAGIGGTALGRLASAGILVYMTSAATLGHVLSQIRAGGLGSLESARGHRRHEA